jgi:hypothetical protein
VVSAMLFSKLAAPLQSPNLETTSLPDDVFWYTPQKKNGRQGDKTWLFHQNSCVRAVLEVVARVSFQDYFMGPPGLIPSDKVHFPSAVNRCIMQKPSDPKYAASWDLCLSTLEAIVTSYPGDRTLVKPYSDDQAKLYYSVDLYQHKVRRFVELTFVNLISAHRDCRFSIPPCGAWKILVHIVSYRIV